MTRIDKVVVSVKPRKASQTLCTSCDPLTYHLSSPKPTSICTGTMLLSWQPGYTSFASSRVSVLPSRWWKPRVKILDPAPWLLKLSIVGQEEVLYGSVGVDGECFACCTCAQVQITRVWRTSYRHLRLSVYNNATSATYPRYRGIRCSKGIT